jgi:hypothetical protein
MGRFWTGDPGRLCRDTRTLTEEYAPPSLFFETGDSRADQVMCFDTDLNLVIIGDLELTF